jgi:putative ABC transport system permease protein
MLSMLSMPTMNPIARRGAAAQRTTLLLISLLVAVSAAAVFAIPGYLDAHRAVALRGALAAAKDQIRTGITETAQLNPRTPVAASNKALGKADQWGAEALPQGLDGILGAPTVVAMSAGAGLEGGGSQTKLPLTTIADTPPGFGLRAPYGSDGKLRAVAGQAPPAPGEKAPPGPAAPTAAAEGSSPSVWGWISQASATKLHVSVGDQLVLGSNRWNASVSVHVTIAGIFAPADPQDPWWTDPGTGAANALAAPFIDTFYSGQERGGEEKSYWHADLLVNDSGAQEVSQFTNMAITWSYPLKPSAITPGNAARVVADVTRFKSATNLPSFPQVATDSGEQVDILKNPGVTSPLPPVLAGYLSRAGTSMVVMSLGLAVLAAVSIGVLALAVRLLIHRQRDDLVVARARGASLPELARSVGYQVAANTTPAVAAAVAAARAAGYAKIDGGSVLLAVGVVAGTFLLAAGQAAAALRGSTGSLGFLTRRLGGRTDAAVRAGLELIVLALLAGQIMTLRSRGLGSATSGIDPVVATLPVTVALAAGVVLLRVAPLVPRMLALMFGSGRGATGFVATSSARRSAVIGPLAAVVILATLSGSVFGATFTRSLSVARDDSQWGSVGGGAHIDDPFAGFGSSSVTSADLAKIRALPGITAAAGGAIDGGATFSSGSADAGSGQPVTLVGLDVADYLNVIKGTPLDTAGLHRALTVLEQASTARPASDYSQAGSTHPPLPALLTSGAAPGTGGTVQGTVQYAGLPVTIVTNAPELPTGMAPKGEAVLVIDYRILKAELGSEPARSDAWVSGGAAALAGLSTPGLLSEPNDQVAVQAGLTDTAGTNELDRLTERVYAAETALEALLCALAVLLTLAAGSAARRRAAAFLATMGFGRRRLRRIAVLEALPMLVVVTAGGLATGLGTVPLLAGSVDLSSLAGLTTSRLAVHTNVAVVTAATVAVPGVALLAVFVEAALRRPMTLVSTLRSER